MWLDEKLVEVLPPAVKRKFSGYYRLIRPLPQHPSHPPLTKAQLQRLTLLVWAVAGLVVAALIASTVIGSWI
jgi:hypothetical protein